MMIAFYLISFDCESLILKHFAIHAVFAVPP